MCAKFATLPPHDPEHRPEGMEPYEPPQRTALPMQECPVGSSLDIFSRKWTFLLLRDVAFYKLGRYSQFLRNNPGMTPRILSKRLGEMVDEGLLVRIGEGKETQYRLGPRGSDALPMLVALFRYGVRHRADAVFPDGRERRLSEVVPEWDGAFLLRLFGETP